MEKLYALFAKIVGAVPDFKYLPKDKVAHFVIGALVQVPFSVAGMPFEGLMLVIGLAILKEVVDYLRNGKAAEQGLEPPHGVELADLVWTVAGAGVTALTAWLLLA